MQYFSSIFREPIIEAKHTCKKAQKKYREYIKKNFYLYKNMSNNSRNVVGDNCIIKQKQ